MHKPVVELLIDASTNGVQVTVDNSTHTIYAPAGGENKKAYVLLNSKTLYQLIDLLDNAASAMRLS